ncbi:MAG: hypothetical protein IPH20_21140 [Bacteroidales bacterium]|nr:hypothetical protein [Bacteroidales bacterium]
MKEPILRIAILQVDEAIAENEKQLEKLFEEIMNDDMKKLFDELRKMMENLDRTIK